MSRRTRERLFIAAVVALLVTIGTQAAAFAAADVQGAPDYSAAWLVTGLTLASFVGSVAVAYGKIRGLLDAKFEALEGRIDRLEDGKVDLAVHDACYGSILRALEEVGKTSRSNGERLDRVLEVLAATGTEETTHGS